MVLLPEPGAPSTSVITTPRYRHSRASWCSSAASKVPGSYREHVHARYVPDGSVGNGGSRSLAEHRRCILTCRGTGQACLSHSFPS